MSPGNGDFDIDTAFGDRLAGTFAQLDPSDFELLDPPDDLWDRIAASVAVQSERRPTGSGTVVEYSIDAEDVVFSVDDGWAACARDNDAPELVELPPARTLWSYFDGDEVRDLWRALVRDVRAKQVPAHVPLRCDSPHMRRWFEMTITPARNGVVHIRSVLVFEEPRPSVPFLDRRTDRDDERPAVPFCSWCAKVYDGSAWEEIEVVARKLRLLEDRTPPIASGICPTCRGLMSAEALVAEETRPSGS
jgi:hypothetical protein